MQTSQIATVSDDIKLVTSLGQSVFESDYLSFLKANEELMRKQTDVLTVLEAPSNLTS